MRIGIIGAGRIGSALAEHFGRIGHEVVLSNSRGPESLAVAVRGMPSGVHAGTPREAAEFGEVVVVSIPYGRYRELPADLLRDKVVIDTCNYYPERDGHDVELDSDATTSSECVQAYTGANLVKAFNAMLWTDLRERALPKGDPNRLAVPLSGDDEEAVAVVAGLVRDIGFEPVLAGTLGRGGRHHQPGTHVYGEAINAAESAALMKAAAEVAR